MFTLLKRRVCARRLFCLALLALTYGSAVAFVAEAQTGAWTRQTSGTLGWLHSVYFLDAERGWAVGGKGQILATADGGRTWGTMRAPAEDTLHDVFFADRATGWLVCERSIFKIKSADEPRSYLLKTTNGGETWTRVEVTKPDVVLRLTRIVFADRERGWTFGEAGALYATTDAGASWAKQPVPTRNLLLGASFVDNRQGWIVGGGGSVLLTTDGGAQWYGGSLTANPATRPRTIASAANAPRAAASQASPQAAPRLRLNAVSFVDGRRGWAVGSGGLVVATADGGHTWAKQNSNTDVDLLDVKFINASEGWAVGGEGAIIHTVDGGKTWRAESSGVTHTLERLSLVPPRNIWAVGFGGTILRRAEQGVAPPKLKSGASD